MDLSYINNPSFNKYQFDEDIYFDKVKEMLNKKLEQADLKNELNRFLKLLKLKKSHNDEVVFRKDLDQFIGYIEEDENLKNEELKELQHNSSDLQKFLSEKIKINGKLF